MKRAKRKLLLLYLEQYAEWETAALAEEAAEDAVTAATKALRSPLGRLGAARGKLERYSNGIYFLDAGTVGVLEDGHFTLLPVYDRRVKEVDE